MIKIENNAQQAFKLIQSADWPNVFVNRVIFDSRQVQEGDAFVVLGSVTGDASAYVTSANLSGASLIIIDEQQKLDAIPENCVRIPDLVNQMGSFLHSTLGNATDKMKAVGITGTNGKSSISFYVAQLLEALGCTAAVTGTLGFGRLGSLTDAGMTTMPLDKLHSALAELSIDNQYVAMEVSSHGLHQNRLSGVHFKGAVFTNLTRDHLDYHGDMDSYAEAKSKLFSRPGLEFAVINGDDEYSSIMIDSCTAKNLITYGKKNTNHLQFNVENISDDGLDISLKYKSVSGRCVLPLYGEFNAYNAVAAFGALLGFGFKFERVLSAMCHLRPVPGRMQSLNNSDLMPVVLVDYAHTPDALKQVLESARNHCRGKLHVVVGCGGDRDPGKRAPMGDIAVTYADSAIITSDNPRSEDPLKIANEMVAGLNSHNFSIEVDRANAIREAITHASPEDLIMIAGKGHENYQEINGHRYDFDDAVVALSILEEGCK